LIARIGELEGRLSVLNVELERARTEVERERGERLEERARADRLAAEVTALAKQLAVENRSGGEEGA